MTNKKQIKSKERVADYGEVFTGEREVNAMLDMVKPETERIDSRFLEPACGDGNFLAEILRRKLMVVHRKYGKNQLDYEKNAILALTSIYGVDILEDNVIECRKRLFAIWDKDYTKHWKNSCDNQCRRAAQYILDCNILCGNTLNTKKNDGTPIIFAQWDFVLGTQIKRQDYRLDELLETNDKQKPIKEYPLMDFRRIGNE